MISPWTSVKVVTIGPIEHVNTIQRIVWRMAVMSQYSSQIYQMSNKKIKIIWGGKAKEQCLYIQVIDKLRLHFNTESTIERVY